MLARFEAERQALALMRHPCVAQVYDGGMTKDGRPYFAMELVEGTSLREHARAHALTIDQRAELLIKICDAVHHAHQKGVIHRDLKPANIVVTDDGEPKVLDFGVARVIDNDVRTTTMHTRAGDLVGLPAGTRDQHGRGHRGLSHPPRPARLCPDVRMPDPRLRRL